MASIVTEGSADALGVVSHLGPYWCLGAMLPTRAVLIWVVCAAAGFTVAFRPELLPRAMCGSLVLLQLGFVVMSMFCFTTGVIRIMLH